MSATSDISFGNWLKQHRRESGITRDELAERTSCSSITLQKIEAGERRPSRQLALLLADLFHLPADEREAFVTFARTSSTGRTPALSVSSGTPAVHAAPLAPGSSPQITNGRQPQTQTRRQTEPEEYAPWRAAHLRQSNLPQSLTSFIGREADEQAVRALILLPRVRLLTLVGTPGIGKTRLSLEVAARADVAEHFGDGVCLVELAPITDPSLVVPTIARALGLKEPGGPQETLASLLLNYLQDKRMLLVLDNFEQVLDAAPGVVQLIQSSPWLKVLVTSREALNVKGERRFQVPPLQLPVLAGLTNLASPLDLEALSHNPAVALFVERAQDAHPDFDLTKGNAEDIVIVCAGLDGLPLTIELAAARANMLSVRQMREALGRRLKLLSKGTRDLPARYRTLREAIDWSYDLLDDGEKQLFRRISVFAGGRTLEAIGKVCNADGTLQLDVLEGVESLLGKSLLKQEEGVGGEPRFVMLETIHEYAREKLEESGEGAELAQHHAEYFVTLAEEAGSKVQGPHQGIWFSHLESEHDNLRAALGWSQRTEGVTATEIGLRLVGALVWFWDIRGYRREGYEHARAALSKSGDEASGPTGARARAINVTARLSEGLTSSEEVRILYETGLRTWRDLGDKLGISRSLMGLGHLARNLGDYPTANTHYEAALNLRRDLGDKGDIVHTLTSISDILYAQGDYSGALRYLEESYTLVLEVDDPLLTANVLSGFALIALDQGDYSKAADFFDRSLSLSRDLGFEEGIRDTLKGKGQARLRAGNYSQAKEIFRECITLSQEQSDPNPWDLLGMAEVVSAQRQPERGIRLLAAADALFAGQFKTTGGSLNPRAKTEFERVVATIRAQAQLNMDDWEKVWAEGRAMTVKQAIAYALEEKEAR